MRLRSSYGAPGAKLSLQNGNRPEKLYTVFAGVDTDATAKIARIPAALPSVLSKYSPFQGRPAVHFLERRHIEGRSAQIISDNLRAAYHPDCQ
jgi:putative YphP/YqiW family bacilliredoxin